MKKLQIWLFTYTMLILNFKRSSILHNKIYTQFSLRHCKPTRRLTMTMMLQIENVLSAANSVKNNNKNKINFTKSIKVYIMGNFYLKKRLNVVNEKQNCCKILPKIQRSMIKMISQCCIGK